MPFHDVAVCIEGESVIDLCHHFVHYWNNTKLDKHGKKAKLASITTHAKYEGIFRKVFKKMNPSSTTGMPGLGHKDKAVIKKEKEIIKAF
jgi:phosphatidylserine/phosphatidylglycerophosphate/cardiolipin synthase-like enzyme